MAHGVYEAGPIPDPWIILADIFRKSDVLRGIIDYFGEKSFVSFITHAGNGCILVAVAESGAAAVECLQATTVVSRCKSPPGW